jgi:hypothetical protein
LPRCSGASIFEARGRRFATIFCLFSWPYETRFTAGKLPAQVTIAEVIARHFGPQVLLPATHPPVPILVQAGDDPSTVLAAWDERRAALPFP